MSAGDPVAVQGGTLEGTGTIAADVTNAAVVAPGPGLGTLTVTGNYAQAAAGTLAVEIGGTAPGQADRLNVAGTTSLDGALDVGFVNGFVPAILDHFTLLDPTGGGPIAGTFAGLDEGTTFSVPGPATFRVTYAGGGNDVALTALNIAPTLDPIPDQPVPNGPLVLEDGGPHTVSLTGISSGNAQAQTLTVTATSSDPTVIPDPGVAYTSPDAAGTLTYQPAANRSGDVVITVTVSDDGGTGDGGVSQVVRQFTVHVLPVNDEPTLDPISDPTAIPPIPDPDPIPEDAGQQTINLTGISAGGDETQTLTVTATSSDPTIVPEPTVTYSTPDATGSLTYTPLPNQYGTVTITVRVTDDGGTANGGDDEVVRTFTVTVEPRPDAPTLDTDPLTVLPPIPVRTRLTPDPTGTLVADLIAHKTTDADGDPVGIAVIGLDPANTVNLKGVPKFGVWEFTTDGTLWNLIPTGPTGVSATSALVLSADAQTRVRFKPNLLFHGLSRFTFLAWDHSDGATPGLPADTTATPTAYSTAPKPPGWPSARRGRTWTPAGQRAWPPSGRTPRRRRLSWPRACSGWPGWRTRRRPGWESPSPGSARTPAPGTTGWRRRRTLSPSTRRRRPAAAADRHRAVRPGPRRQRAGRPDAQDLGAGRQLRDVRRGHDRDRVRAGLWGRVDCDRPGERRPGPEPGGCTRTWGRPPAARRSP